MRFMPGSGSFKAFRNSLAVAGNGLRKLTPLILMAAVSMACVLLAGCWQTVTRPYRNVTSQQPFKAGAVTEKGPDGKETYVSGFAIDQATGQLTFLNNMSAHGGWPCYVSIDKTGSTLLVANYANGSVASFPIQPDGKIGTAATVDQHKGKSINPERQAGPHAHFLAPSPDNRFALSADLGLDQVLIYRLDPATSKLTPNTPSSAALKPGAGADPSLKRM